MTCNHYLHQKRLFAWQFYDINFVFFVVATVISMALVGTSVLIRQQWKGSGGDRADLIPEARSTFIQVWLALFFIILVGAELHFSCLLPSCFLSLFRIPTKRGRHEEVDIYFSNWHRKHSAKVQI